MSKVHQGRQYESVNPYQYKSNTYGSIPDDRQYHNLEDYRYHTGVSVRKPSINYGTSQNIQHSTRQHNSFIRSQIEEVIQLCTKENEVTGNELNKVTAAEKEIYDLLHQNQQVQNTIAAMPIQTFGREQPTYTQPNNQQQHYRTQSYEEQQPYTRQQHEQQNYGRQQPNEQQTYGRQQPNEQQNYGRQQQQAYGRQQPNYGQQQTYGKQQQQPLRHTQNYETQPFFSQIQFPQSQIQHEHRRPSYRVQYDGKRQGYENENGGYKQIKYGQNQYPMEQTDKNYKQYGQTEQYRQGYPPGQQYAGRGQTRPQQYTANNNYIESQYPEEQAGQGSIKNLLQNRQGAALDDDEIIRMIEDIQNKAIREIQELRADKIELMRRLNQQISNCNFQKKKNLQLQNQLTLLRGNKNQRQYQSENVDTRRQPQLQQLLFQNQRLRNQLEGGHENDSRARVAALEAELHQERQISNNLRNQVQYEGNIDLQALFRQGEAIRQETLRLLKIKLSQQNVSQDEIEVLREKLRHLEEQNQILRKRGTTSHYRTSSGVPYSPEKPVHDESVDRYQKVVQQMRRMTKN